MGTSTGTDMGTAGSTTEKHDREDEHGYWPTGQGVAGMTTSRSELVGLDPRLVEMAPGEEARHEDPWALSSGSPVDEVRVAARCGQFRPYVQPVVDMQRDHRVVGAESLLRWHHPQRGVLAAGQFLHLVEEAELLADVDLATAEHLAADMSRLDRTGQSIERVWLNVSVSELFSDRFLETVASVVERAGLGGKRIGLEVPEVVFSIDETPVKRRLSVVRRLGVAVAIDHFGRALQLRHLGAEPFDVVKIDRSLIQRADQDRVPRQVASAVVELGHASGAEVVAEGVERKSQVDVLQDLGVDGAQGYLFGRAVPISELLGPEEPGPPPCIWLG
jgi:EAL domain-containing protein (putative c-di-GMP-specific phosphodiesterase class I)